MSSDDGITNPFKHTTPELRRGPLGVPQLAPRAVHELVGNEEYDWMEY